MFFRECVEDDDLVHAVQELRPERVAQFLRDRLLHQLIFVAGEGATVCFSWYSDMSMRIISCTSSNRTSARARASSVLPPPVGPRKMKLPMGRLGSLRPERARTTASATASTASS